MCTCLVSLRAWQCDLIDNIQFSVVLAQAQKAENEKKYGDCTFRQLLCDRLKNNIGSATGANEHIQIVSSDGDGTPSLMDDEAFTGSPRCGNRI